MKSLLPLVLGLAALPALALPPWQVTPAELAQHAAGAPAAMTVP
ncbi:MAG: hypothetical protein QG602_112, partial [Verrucomicrobiota bacterium]|nr:hypothetical protein [Verrucomicrobiota bacterium]